MSEQEGQTKTLPVVRSLEKNILKKLALEVLQRMKSESLSAFYDENADIFRLLLIGWVDCAILWTDVVKLP